MIARRWAPILKYSRGAYQIESKEELRKRLGRSPGKGDAVVMCLSEGQAALRRNTVGGDKLPSTANTGYAHLKRRQKS